MAKTAQRNTKFEHQYETYRRQSRVFVLIFFCVIEWWCVIGVCCDSFHKNIPENKNITHMYSAGRPHVYLCTTESMSRYVPLLFTCTVDLAQEKHLSLRTHKTRSCGSNESHTYIIHIRVPYFYLPFSVSSFLCLLLFSMRNIKFINLAERSRRNKQMRMREPKNRNGIE